MVSNHGVVGLLGSVVRCLVLGGRHVVEVAVQPLGVEPVDPTEGRELDVVDGAPWSLVGAADQLRLVERVRRLCQGVVERLSGQSARAVRCRRVGLSPDFGSAGGFESIEGHLRRRLKNQT